MIWIFPDPYPDELIYSVCARYKELMKYPNDLTANQDFFGKKNISAVVDLPNRLSHLKSAIFLGHLYTIDEFIDKNTLFRIYAPFLPSERANLIRSEMQECGNNHIAERLGIKPARVRKNNWLRFCPKCVQENRQTFGETYWHRIHQVVGIDVCPHHAVCLENSTAPWWYSQNYGVAYSAEQSVCDVQARYLDCSKVENKILLEMSQWAEWLLKWNGYSIGGDEIRRRYYNLLLRRGFAYFNGNIRTAELVNGILEFYPSEMLKRLGCQIKKIHSNWITRLLNTSTSRIVSHPIHHILLLVFMQCTPENIFTAFEEYKPFGDGPWPCLNKASGHYKKRRASCRISDGEKKNLGKPSGKFSCDCGFIYTRVGPDKTEADRFKFTSVQAYGRVWETALDRFWNDPALTIREIASKLGVRENTVKRRALYLNLKYPRNNLVSPSVVDSMPKRYKIVRRTQQELLEHYRQELLILLAEHPEAERTELNSIKPFVLEWLRQNDHDWLGAHIPKARKSFPPPVRNDWEKEDKLLAEAVKNVVSDILEAKEPLLRVSKSEIIRRVGHRAWIERSGDKIPLTIQAIKMCVESYEQFVIRKIEWGVQSYGTEEAKSFSQFCKRTGIIYHAGKSPLIQKTLDDVYLVLKTKVEAT